MEVHDIALNKLVQGVLINLMECIEKPQRIIDRHNKRAQVEWLLDVMDWAKRKDNVWLQAMDEIFEYDRERLANHIVRAVEEKLKNM